MGKEREKALKWDPGRIIHFARAKTAEGCICVTARSKFQPPKVASVIIGHTLTFIYRK